MIGKRIVGTILNNWYLDRLSTVDESFLEVDDSFSEFDDFYFFLEEKNIYFKKLTTACPYMSWKPNHCILTVCYM